MVSVYGLTLRQAVWYVRVPPVFAAVGLAGGWLSLRFIGRGHAAPAHLPGLHGRKPAVPAYPWIPLALSPAWVSAEFLHLAVAAFSVNMYTLPLDVSAPRPPVLLSPRSSRATAIFVIAPIVGTVIDHHGYTPKCVVSFTPLMACAVLVHEVRDEAVGLSPAQQRSEAVVVTFCSAIPSCAAEWLKRCVAVPDRRHFATEENWPELRAN
jgi:hypothetical protein